MQDINERIKKPSLNMFLFKSHIKQALSLQSRSTYRFKHAKSCAWQLMALISSDPRALKYHDGLDMMCDRATLGHNVFHHKHTEWMLGWNKQKKDNPPVWQQEFERRWRKGIGFKDSLGGGTGGQRKKRGFFFQAQSLEIKKACSPLEKTVSQSCWRRA